MRIGLFGFPLTGKTTLFNLLTGLGADDHGQVHVPGEVRIGVVKVPDPRLEQVAELSRPRPKKVTAATIEYLDLAGMEKGQAVDVLPLDQLRTADALAHVVRAFEDPALPHVEGPIDPARDVATMETELILADHTTVERRIAKLEPLVLKAHKEDDIHELELLKRCLAVLEQDTPLRQMELSEDEQRRLRGFTFLSMKPVLVVVNAGENDAAKVAQGAEAFGLAEVDRREHLHVVALSAKIESEIAQLDPEDAAAFRADLGFAEPALDRMIRASYDLLGRITFFTANENECHAWTVPRGTPAVRAAGAVHSDMERGFIRAETVHFKDLIEAGSWAACREHGTLHVEGKQHVVEDGDVINFRFNV